MATDELTPRDVAAELGVTVRTVQRWIADGRLPATRIGGRVRVSRMSLSSVADTSRSVSTAPIRRLLVANRGEIVERIARTARRLGIAVVGVHLRDERPPHGVDSTRPIGSYLDADELVRAATASAADAVHPGYGFLAESPAFARAVGQAGLRWVGPPPEAIAAMGDKAAARRRATGQGIPTVPGYDGEAQDDATLVGAAVDVGFPLLVKPSAGGGGKGMHLVRDADALPEALGAARREAMRSFGDDRLVLERFLEAARHVEVQVLFDGHGNGVHLGERDCSAQRRSQKVVEEAPGPSVDAALRDRLGSTALAVARSVGYVGAGTVEMLVTDAGDHFFLEMNTRLQVEHAVTEAVVGRDLVEDQLRIAAGASLADLGLDRPPPMRGHAIEARVYAEDPENGFLPASGTLLSVTWPADVRVDTGVRAGDTVSDRFDPMLAKLVARGADRADALGGLRAAVADTTLVGVRTNLRFLRWLLDSDAMRDGDVRTDTISKSSLPGPPVPDDAAWLAAATALARRFSDDDPWSGGWRLNGPPALLVSDGTEERRVVLRGASDRAVEVADGVAHVLVDGQSVEFRSVGPPTVDEAIRHASAAGGDGPAQLVAPMPGRVVAVRTRVGGTVVAHDPLVVIEAMKMEHAVVAPRAGEVTAVHVSEGDQVERGEIVVEIGAYHGADG